MQGESAVIPVTETTGASRTSLHVRYLRLLRANANFRRLWLAQLISEIGDWFYSLAIYDLLLEATHSGKAVSYAIIIQALPWFFMTPLAGHLVDRFSRRRLMILADVARGFVVLGLLRAGLNSDVWLVYALLGLEVIFSSVFEPSRNAILPDVASVEEILPANALSSATWSLALTSGAALGGMVTALLGRRVAFVINSVSFFASAFLIQHIRVAEPHLESPHAARRVQGGSSGVNSLREGREYLEQNPKIVVLILAKTGLGIVSGALLLLVIFGERVFPVAGHGALAVGLLYAARGVGAGIGPLVGDRASAGIEHRMWKVIGIGFFIMSISYVTLSRAPNLALAALCVLCAHAGGSNVWVMSTTLLQVNVPDRFRGRVFAVDLGLLMLMVSGSNYLIGVGLDTWKLSARQLAAALGGALLLPGLAWLPAQAKWGRHSGCREKSEARSQE
ncbi:MAG: MFS transporter [Acidobacteria bacterium]|nr:MAG: MFS transporter [Acidobacteriota bacterium]